MAAAAAQLPDGLVDGELVVWDTAVSRLSFEALQRRAAARGRTAAALAVETPAFFIAFDALQIDGTKLLALPYAERRRRLEVLFASRQLTSPRTLCPQTTDPVTAQEWMERWTHIPGVEGLVLKRLNQHYRALSPRPDQDQAQEHHRGDHRRHHRHPQPPWAPSPGPSRCLRPPPPPRRPHRTAAP
ncbi:hypothetical protein ACIBEA_41595 [Streptomyces sp. NPDC051555]|uniref:ATP-dependent DNA ligase n=1 Tax=Streptomyces sp. NPDC051555 TaxID=3365657 RepID=UPI0037B7C3A1